MPSLTCNNEEICHVIFLATGAKIKLVRVNDFTLMLILNKMFELFVSD